MTQSLPTFRRLVPLFLLAIGFCVAPPAFGQLDLNALGGNVGVAAGDDQAALGVAASITVAKDGQPARLVVTADIAPAGTFTR